MTRNDPKNDEKQKSIRQISAFILIPFALAVPPMMGWFIGNWLDHTFGWTPYATYILLFFGFIGGCREVYRIIKRFGDDT